LFGRSILLDKASRKKAEQQLAPTRGVGRVIQRADSAEVFADRRPRIDV
jgi:hypothetical protein